MTTPAATTSITLLQDLPAALRDELGIAAADDDTGDALALPHDDAVRLVADGYARFGSTATDPASTTLGQKPTRTATATLDFPSVAAGAVQTLAVPVPGAKVGELVAVGAPSDLDAALVVGGKVTAVNSVTVSVANPTGAAIDPTSGAWKVAVVNSLRP